MLTGMYSAASGMIVQEKIQDNIAQNLAGSSMPGYRREELIVRSFPDVMLYETYRGVTPTTDKPRYNHAIGRVGTGAGVDWTYVNHTAGASQYTGNPTDLLIDGGGFFTVQTPDGFRFTRAGSFMVDKDGFLTTPQGHYVVGQGVNNGRQPGPIQVGNEEFHVDRWGQIFAKRPDPATGIPTSVMVDQARVVDFKDKDLLFREPGNLFRVEPGTEDNVTVPENLSVHQGYIERSNSIPTTEMVKLIDTFRNYQANSRVIQALDQTLQRAVNSVGRVS